MVKNCIVCNKEFKTFKSTQHKKIFCSPECRLKKSHIEAECMICGKKYTIAKSRYNGKFIRYKCCSDECYHNYRTEEKRKIYEKNIYTCSSCGEKFHGARHGNTGYKFCSQSCSKSFMKGSNSLAYKDGSTINSAGYKCIKVGDKYLYEHRLIIEEHIGRKLTVNEVVHHKDGDKLNNSIENLQIMDKKEHDRLHNNLRRGSMWQTIKNY